MASLDDLEILILSKMRPKHGALTRGHIAAMLPVKLTDEHLDLALRHLAQCELVEINDAKNGDTFYTLTLPGSASALAMSGAIGELERRYVERFTPIVPDNGMRAAKAPVDWTKWGTVVAAVGLLVAILIAVID